MTEFDAHAEYHALLDRCQFSRINHQRRERFFDRVDGFTKFVAVVGGASALYKLAGEMPLVSFIITFTSLLSLVVGYAKRARLHADLAKAFNELEAEVIEIGVEITPSQSRALNAKLVRCELNEPRSYGVIVRMSQNEVLQASGRDTRPVTGWQRFWGHVWDFDMSVAPKPSIRQRLWKRWNDF